MKVFYKHGFRGTGLDTVLKESGISRMTLYNHFKSKEDLIVAALRLRDEEFRKAMMGFVESASRDPIDHIFAVFDYHEDWFNDENFQGCMFINVAGEYCDPESPARRVAADHKLWCVRYIAQLCASAGIADADETAERIILLLEGAIVTAHVVGNAKGNERTPTDAIRRAKRMAQELIDAQRLKSIKSA